MIYDVTSIRRDALLETGPSEIGWHSHGSILTCPQKYAYGALLGLPQSYSKPRSLGTALHLAMAHWYFKAGSPEAWAISNLAEPEVAINLYLGLESEVLSHAHYLWREYQEFYPIESDLAEWQVLEVESDLRVSIDDIPYAQRADLVWKRRSDNKVFMVDHKTMGGFGNAYGVDQYAMSGQILGLQWIGKELYGPMYGGILINAIRTTPAKQTERFFRSPPPSAPDAVRRFPDLVRRARRLKVEFSKLAPLDYPRVADSTVCGAYGGCDYLATCRFGGA